MERYGNGGELLNATGVSSLDVWCGTGIGVDIGDATACIMLQKALNAFNNGGKLYADLVPDGDCGQKTMDALAAFLRARHSDDGERVLLVAMNCLQGARYIDIASAKPSQEAFCYGWLKNRVSSQI